MFHRNMEFIRKHETNISTWFHALYLESAVFMHSIYYFPARVDILVISVLLSLLIIWKNKKRKELNQLFEIYENILFFFWKFVPDIKYLCTKNIANCECPNICHICSTFAYFKYAHLIEAISHQGLNKSHTWNRKSHIKHKQDIVQNG